MDIFTSSLKVIYNSVFQKKKKITKSSYNYNNNNN